MNIFRQIKIWWEECKRKKRFKKKLKILRKNDPFIYKH